MSPISFLLPLALIALAAPVLSESPMQDSVLAPTLKPQPEPDRGISQGRMTLTAYGLAAAATAIPGTLFILEGSRHDPNPALLIPLALAGFLAGPSAGQFYAESYRTGAGGLAIRAAGMSLISAGLILTDSENVYMTYATLGILTFGGGVAYSFVDTKRAVKRSIAREKGIAFGLGPILVPGRDGVSKSGAMARMRF